MTRIIIIRVNFREVVFFMFLLTIGRYGTTFIQLSVGMYYFYSDPTNQIYPDQAHPINLDQLLPTYIRIQPFLS